MSRYVVILLLINYYTVGLGHVIKDSSPKASIQLGKSLTDLAKRCESNSFISKQISNRINDCNVDVPPYKQEQLKCLTFFDINSQLCSSAVIQHNFSQDFSMNMEGKQNVSVICKQASQWNITVLEDFPKYKSVAEQVFKQLPLCSKLCLEEDYLSGNEDSSFFCKYYNWANNVLKQINQNSSHTAVIGSLVENVNSVSSNDTSGISNKEHSQPGQIAGKPENSGPSIVTEQQQKIEQSNKITISSKAIIEETSNNQLPQPQLVPSANEIPSEQGEDNIIEKAAAINEIPEFKPSMNDQNSNNEKIELLSAAVEKTSTKPSSSTLLPIEQKIPTKQEKPTDKNKPVVDEKVKNSILNNDNNMYDSNDENDRNDLGNMDDDDNTIIGDEDKPEQIDQLEKNKITLKADKQLISNNEVSQKVSESMQNPYQDGFGDESDDHFFSFFLTSVIIVIFLYVLYHNKSKVTKVILGLIVEGRQSGRRRNSRGHSYRRLDTLEQAMSTNTAVPPTKIIY